MLLILSEPTTTTFLWVPLEMNCPPVRRAKRKPLQAALRSNPQALVAPALWQASWAVEGKNMSGVTVATMTRSISSAAMPRCSQRPSMTMATMSDVAFSGSLRMRRSLMPVRVRIHSSLVSTIFSRSALLRTSGGSQPWTAVMAAVWGELIGFGFG